MARKSESETYFALLNAAERVVFRDGVGALTLDAVAAEAGVSKGGLLYHFPTKDALIEHMVVRSLAEWLRDFETLLAAETAGPGRAARAFVKWGIETSPEVLARTARLASVCLAAVVNTPGLLKKADAVYGQVLGRLRAEPLPAVLVDLLRTSVDGFWLAHALNMDAPTPERTRELREYLLTLIDGALKR